MELRGRDIFFGAVFLALAVAALAVGTYTWGFQAGWNTAEPELIVETVEVPAVQTVVVEKPCVVSCPCGESTCEPCEPCEVPEAPAVTPTPIPTPKEPGCPSVFGDHPIGEKETWQVPDCWTCLGDLKVEGIELYDNIAETGLVIYFAEGAEVYAEWGANCISGDHRAEKKAEALVSGCMGPPEGCKSVDIHVWPEEDPK